MMFAILDDWIILGWVGKFEFGECIDVEIVVRLRGRQAIL